MKPRLETAEIFVPDNSPIDQALARTTYLAVAAHQDDLEIMAFDGILKAFQQPDKWFTGVVVTDGAGSPRDELYKDYTDEAMRVIRRKEQKKAAYVGDYAAQVLLDYPSSVIKNARDGRPKDDLVDLLRATRPEVVYTHNLADKHDTHVATALRVIEAIRSLPAGERPKTVYGCEVWRDLDWMVDTDKVGFDLTAHENLQAALLGVFDSQIAGGKRYDLATQGRRRAHATYYASHGTDTVELLNSAMDLTPLVTDTTIDPAAYVERFIDRLRDDVLARVKKFKA